MIPAITGQRADRVWIIGSDGFQPEATFFEGKVDGVWSPGACFFSIATYKSQKIREVSIFKTVKKFCILKRFKLTLKIDLTFLKGRFWP